MADVFDALTSERPYKPALPWGESVAIVKDCSGSHFDPALLDQFQTIAQPLYRDLIANDHAHIEDQLQRIAEKYFIEPDPILAF